MTPTVSCVRCGTTVPRPKDKRARCAACGTALPLFDDDPNLPVPELPVPDRVLAARAAPPPAVASTLTQGDLAVEEVPAREDGWEDFELEPTGERQLPAARSQPPERAALAASQASTRPAAPAPKPAPAPAPAPAPKRTVTPAQAGVAARPTAPAPIPAPAPAPTFAAARGAGQGSKVPLVVGALALLLVGGGAALFLRGGGEAAPAPATAPPAVVQAPPAEPAPAQAATPPAEVPPEQAAPSAPAAPPAAVPRQAAPATARPAPQQAAAVAPPPAPPPARPAARPATPEPPTALRASRAESRTAELRVVSPERAAAPAAQPAVTPAAPPPPSPPPPTPAPAPAPAPAAVTAPPPVIQVVDPTSVNRKPRLVEAGCIQSNLRLPRNVATDGAVRVRFSVGLDGQPTDLTFLDPPGDARVETAIRQAVQQCRFLPGTDQRGAPAVLPVIMPFRFDAQ